MTHDLGLPRPDSRLLETDSGTPPAEPTPVSQQGLPEDLLREAAQRLAYTALISGGLWLANWLAVHFIHPLPGTFRGEELALHARWVQVFDWVGGSAFLASVGLFWYTRKSRRSPRFLLDLALGYELFITLNIGTLNYAVGYPQGVSWIAIIILLFPPVIPSTPRKTLVTALLAASMDPVGALIWKTLGSQVIPMREVFILAIPNYLCALVAPLISHIITRLGRELRRAREMGSYILGDRIGAGGMGEVWQATHRFLVRPAAIN